LADSVGSLIAEVKAKNLGEPGFHHAIQEAVEEKKVYLRLAAMVVAVARVAEASKLRGWV